MKVNNILNYLEQRFPYELAADFDLNKIGLSIGDGYAEVKGILCALVQGSKQSAVEKQVKQKCNTKTCYTRKLLQKALHAFAFFTKYL